MKAAGALLAVVLLACSPGCVVVRDDLLAGGSFSPQTLPFSGGPVRVEAELMPGLGDEPTVTATISPAYGNPVTSVLRAGPGGGVLREAILTVPPNAAPSGEGQTCVVTVKAELSGTQRLTLGVVTLAGTSAPPGPPG